MSEPQPTASQPDEGRRYLSKILPFFSNEPDHGGSILPRLRRLPRWQRRLSLSLLVNAVLAVVTIGSTIAAFILAFVDSRPSDAVADDPAFVIVSYLGAFAPFQALEAADYIGPKWKTVHETRRVGQLQYVVGIFGLSTLVLYTNFQRLAGDFKEMSAAIVVLLFSVLNLLRTSRGLRELDEFKRWAVVSIDTLCRLGVRYRIGDLSAVDIGASKLADRIKVNEFIVDNKIYNGRTMIRVSSPVHVRDVRTTTHALPRELLEIIATTEIWASIKNVSDFLWPLLPTEPVELWLDWATVFTAQGLKCWLTHPELKLPHTQACLSCNCRSIPTERDGVTDQSFDLWKEDLNATMKYGTGLPFRSAHLLEDKHHDDDLIRNGYKSYEAKLARGIEALPPEFGTEIQNFNTHLLARLAVMLSGGADLRLSSGS